jgi:ubiquitin-conjugating enzyme E2 C
VAKRLRTELAQIVMGSCSGVSAFPGSDILQWTGTIEGPSATVYEGVTFALSISFPLEYPYTAPTVKFVTPCFHPNVDTAGNICLDILSEQWSAAYTTSTVLLSIQSLLAQPNTSDPLNPDAAQMWEDQRLFRETARSFAQVP